MKIPNAHTANQASNALRIIKEFGPIKAIDLARRLALDGNRETQRRRVRAIVKHLRDDGGVMVIANLADGYFITEDKKDWAAYLDGKQIKAKKTLGQTHKQIKMTKDSAGQGLLFVPGMTMALV